MGLEKVGVEAIVKGLGKFRTDMAGIQGTVNKVGKSIGSVVRKATIGAGIAMAGFGVLSVKAAGDFDAAMTQSLAIMGDVSDALREDMADAAREMALVTTFSAKQAAEAYFFLASAGMDAVESMESMPIVAQFAQAGMFDLALATDLLTDAQSALGLRSEDTAKNLEEMTRVGDVLVKMNQMANASVEQFATALTQKGASALKGMNKSLEEGAGMLAFWADQGLKGEAAGNALAGVLQMLPKIAQTNTDAFARYGVEIFDASGKMKSFADIADEFIPILENMTDAQRAQAFEQMGINRLLADSILKMKGGSEAIREYTAAAYDAAGATEEVAEKQLKTFNAQLSLLRSALEDVMIEIGTELLPKLVNLVTAIREEVIPALKDWWQKHLPEIKAALEAFGRGLYMVSEALTTFGQWLITHQTALVGAIVAIGLAFAWTNPVLFALVGTGGLVFALGLFGKKSEEVGSATEAAFLQMRATVLRVLADIVHGLAQTADAYLAFITLGLSKLSEWAGAIDNMAQGYYDLADMMYEEAEASQALVDAWEDVHVDLANQIRLIDLSTTKWRLYGDEVRRAAGAVGLIGPPLPSQVSMRVPILDPWARRYVEEANKSLQNEWDSNPPPDFPSPDTGGAVEAIEKLLTPTEAFNDVVSDAVSGVDALYSALGRLLGLETVESLDEQRQILELQIEAFNLEAQAASEREAKDKRIAEIERKIALARKQGDEELVDRLQARKEKEEDVLGPAEKQLEIIEDQIDAIKRLGKKRQLGLDLLRVEGELQNANLLTDYGREAVAGRIVGKIAESSRETENVIEATLRWLGHTEDVAAIYARILLAIGNIAAFNLAFGSPIPPGITAEQIPEFHGGGVVPGPPGQPVLAMVHGNELILPAGAPAFTMPISVTVQGLDWSLIRRTVHVEVDSALDSARSKSTRAGAPIGSGIG